MHTIVTAWLYISIRTTPLIPSNYITCTFLNHQAIVNPPCYYQCLAISKVNRQPRIRTAFNNIAYKNAF